MDDFEEAVEMGYLEKFLRQDHDMAETSQTIGEDELDKLMREMTDADLDSLVDHLSVDDVDEAELADLGASTPPSRKADLPSESSSTSGLFSSTSRAADVSPAKTDTKSTPTKSTAEKAEPVREKAERLLASVGAAVSELGQKAAEAVHAVEEKVEGLAAEPASVTAAKEELEEGTSPIKETRAEPPVESDSRTAADLVELDKKEVASSGPLPNEPTLDELIDTTLAKESIEAEKKDDEEAKKADEEGEKERKQLLAETKESEAAIHKADSAQAAPSEPSNLKIEKDEAKLAEKQEQAATEAARKVEESFRAADAKDEPLKETTLDSLIDKTMEKEHKEYEAKKEEAKDGAAADAKKTE